MIPSPDEGLAPAVIRLGDQVEGLATEVHDADKGRGRLARAVGIIGVALLLLSGVGVFIGAEFSHFQSVSACRSELAAKEAKAQREYLIFQGDLLKAGLLRTATANDFVAQLDTLTGNYRLAGANRDAANKKCN